jgi:hypothetical protein
MVEGRCNKETDKKEKRGRPPLIAGMKRWM